jgi:hypothetical protein
MTATLAKKILLGIGTGLLLQTLASAQEPAGEDAETRRYTIEFIIFRYAEDVGVGTEIFPPEELPADDAYPLAGDFTEEGPIFTDVPIVAPAGPAATQAVGDEVGEDAMGAEETDDASSRLDLVLSLGDALTIDDIRRRLERLDVYESLLYGGWTQATLPQDQAVPLELVLFGDPPAGLDGSFTLYLGRFLHLVVDLTLDAAGAEAGPADAEPAFSFGDSRFGFDRDPLRPEGRVLLRIQEDRIMKNGEIRYFDHPKFGVIAKAMRVEPASGPDDAGVEPAPLVNGFRE